MSEAHQQWAELEAAVKRSRLRDQTIEPVYITRISTTAATSSGLATQHAVTPHGTHSHDSTDRNNSGQNHHPAKVDTSTQAAAAILFPDRDPFGFHTSGSANNNTITGAEMHTVGTLRSHGPIHAVRTDNSHRRTGQSSAGIAYAHENMFGSSGMSGAGSPIRHHNRTRSNLPSAATPTATQAARTGTQSSKGIAVFPDDLNDFFMKGA